MIAMYLNISRYLIKIVYAFFTYLSYVTIKAFSVACLSVRRGHVSRNDFFPY
jgi:hypothetical protein